MAGFEHRLQWLGVRIAELAPWRLRAFQALDTWTLDGEPIAVGTPWPDRRGVHRFAHPEVSFDWPVEETRLLLDLGGEGFVRLGGAQLALDAQHFELPVPGSSFPVDVEIVARLPFGMPNRGARLAVARLVWVDVAVERLLRRLQLAHDTAEALGEVALVEAAASALGVLRWPSATLPYVARNAGTPDLQNVWELPEGLDEAPPGIDGDARASVEEALEVLDRELAAVAERVPPAGELLLTGHAHLDLAWRWPLDETRRKARRTLSTVAGMLERHPEYHFNQSTAQVFAWLEEDDPELLERLVAEPRFETVGGMWVEPDCVMPTGESLARQLLYGQRYFQGRFGAEHSVCWLPDCFGFTPALPQLLVSAGIERFFTIKLSWSETNPFPLDLFHWEGLDGTRVLAHMFDNPDGGYNGVAGPRAALATWRNFKGKGSHGESLLSVGYGDGGGGPTEEMVERVRDMEGFPGLPAQRFGRVDEFFDRIEAGDEVPVWVGELYLELHRGTLTTQGRTKRAHRRAERDLIAAEAVSGLAALAGGEVGESLEPLWRVLLRNEFHDILPGSSIREVYEDAERELGEVIAGAGDVIDARLGELAGRLGARDGEGAVLVVNPDLTPRPLRVELPSGPLTGAREIAGLEAAVVAPGEPGGALRVTDRELENDLVRVTLADDGTLASVWDKRAEREVLDGPGNQLWAYVDKPRAWDAWDLDERYPDQGEPLPAAHAIAVAEDGPHRASIRVERAFRDSTVTQEVRLWANSARVELKTTLDWHDRRFLLKARFPLAVRTQRATFETAFGVMERPTHRNTSWEQARFEASAHRFVDLSEAGYGAALLNDGRYGHHATGSELGISLLRSPIWPDPLADEGTQEIVYALLPHAGGWYEGGVQMEAEDLNRPLLARAVSGEEASLRPLAVEGIPVALGGLKALEDGGGLALRVWEPRGGRGPVRLTLPDGWGEDGTLNILERPAETDGALRPFEIRTWALRQRDL